jgi:hypothetical protein
MPDKFLKYTPALILFIYVLLFQSIKKPYENWDRIINSDGKGYYAYLPSIFIYHDFDYKFIEDYEDRYYPADKSVFKEFRMPYKGETVNKYFPGFAILWLPFFLLAHVLSLIFGFPADGYSIIYQYAIGFANLFYLWLGLLFLHKLLGKLGGSLRMRSFIITIIAFGTNIIFYVLVEPSMGHIYSFFLITAFLYYSKKALDEEFLPDYVLASLFYGITIISRPTNGIVILLLPFLGNNLSQLSQSLKKLFRNKKTLFSVMSMLVGVVLIMPLLWFIQTGHWIVYSYGKESLHFLHPHFFDILFNYDKGWFIYTPIAFLAMIGFIGLFKKSRFKFLILFTFLFIHIYITSSWWAWNYASKFSQRVFIDIYAIIGILLYYLLDSVEKQKVIKIALYGIIVLLIAFNLFQFYQHKTWVFPYGKITKDIYWDSFFRLSPRSKVYLPNDKIIGQKEIFNDFETDKGWDNKESIIDLEGNSVSFLGEGNIYSVEFHEKFTDKFMGANRILKVSADILSNTKNSSATLVVEFQTGTFTYSYNSYYLKTFAKKDNWIQIEYAVYVPENLTKNDFVKVIFFNPNKDEKLWVDNFTVDFITMEPGISIIEGVAFPIINVTKNWDIFNDFEKDKGWGNVKTLTNKKAFSGKFSSFINNEAPFSITFEKKLEPGILSQIKLLKVKSIVYQDTLVSETRMVIEINSDNEQLDYFSFYLNKDLNPGKWSPFEFSTQLPKYNAENIYVKIYFWNPSKLEEIYIDDMKIELFTLIKQN